MKIPETVKIGPHIYTVVYEKNFNDNHSAVGQSRHLHNQIVLDPDQARSSLEDTFIHEIFHAIDWQLHIFDGEQVEHQIARLTTQFLQVLKDNKEVFMSE